MQGGLKIGSSYQKQRSRVYKNTTDSPQRTTEILSKNSNSTWNTRNERKKVETNWNIYLAQNLTGYAIHKCSGDVF